MAVLAGSTGCTVLAGCTSRARVALRALWAGFPLVTLRAGAAVFPRRTICAVLDRGNGRPVHANGRCLAGLGGRYHRAVAVLAGSTGCTVLTGCACRAGHARITFIAFGTVRALEVCHGDKVCPRHAAVRAVLDVAIRHAQVHAASTTACPCRLVDGRHQRALCLRRQVGKVADLALDRLQRHLVCRCVYIPGGLRALMDRKILLHHRVRAGVVGYVGVGRQRVAVLQQLVRDDGRAVCADVHVHAAAKRAILVVDLLHAAAHAQAPPGVPLPQRPAPIRDCDFHAVAPFHCFYNIKKGGIFLSLPRFNCSSGSSRAISGCRSTGTARFSALC